MNHLYSMSDRERFPSFHQVENRPSTLFYADLKVAMAFGIRAVWSTLKNCGDLTKRNPKEVTELYVVLNHLMWEIAGHFGNAVPPPTYKIHKVYKAFEKMFNQIREKIAPTWSNEDREHFFLVTD